MASLCKNLRLVRLGVSYTNHRLGAVRLLSASTLPSNQPLQKPHLGVNPQSTVRSRLLFGELHTVISPRSPATGHDTEPVHELRTTPPAHYLVKIDSFPLLDEHKIDKFETGEFEAGGYKWKLIINPNSYRKELDYISVSLALADTSALPPNWGVNAIFSICLLIQDCGQYRSVLGRARFNAEKTESYISEFILKSSLKRPACGYIVDEKCVFGAEVFVTENYPATENVCMRTFKTPPFKQDFRISDFPSLKDGWVLNKTWTSKVFTDCRHKWRLMVCPNRWEGSNGRLSIFLEHVASRQENPFKYVKASYTICLKSQVSDEYNVKYTCTEKCFSASGGDRGGWLSFIDIDSLYDPTKGFIVDDSVHLQLELSVDNFYV